MGPLTGTVSTGTVATGTVVFTDVGDTLGSILLSPDGDRIETLRVYPFVRDVLQALRARGARLGIISDPGPFRSERVDDALAAAGLGTLFDRGLVLHGPKDSPRIFERAAGLTGDAGRLLFVGEDPADRAQARRAGFSVVPHLALALPALEQRAPLRYVRITVPPDHAGADWRLALRELALVPLHVTGPGTTIYAIALPSAAARLDDLGLWVDRLGGEDDPLTTDLYLLRDDRRIDTGFLRPEGNATAFFGSGAAAGSVLASTEEGLIVAVPGGGSVEDLHFSGARHGHNLKLLPSPALLEPRAIESIHDRPAALEERRPADALPGAATEILAFRITPEGLLGYVERYAGARPIDADGLLLSSRHIHHPDNAAAVAALVADLQRIGEGRFVVRRHRFWHEGRPLDSVEAELPGGGLTGVVLLTAHMDSTAARQAGYQPALDPAPGADDDASGVAGVLLAAETIGALDAALGTPRRAVRFVLFNAEEHGLVGSRAYARDQATLGTPITAVFQLDMIGYDVLPERTFELHAGFPSSPAVEARSLALTRLVAGLGPQVSPALPAPQVYPTDGERDPAEGRSDHYSFQLEGYPACLASEDLFAGPGSGAPPAEMNPNYHLPTDAVVDAGYAADVARLVTAAGWSAATRRASEAEVLPVGEPR